jgi:hypothetical protein
MNYYVLAAGMLIGGGLIRNARPVTFQNINFTY